VHELGCKTPSSTSEFLNIATNFVLGKEVVGVIFYDGKAKGKQKEEVAEALGSCDLRRRRRVQKGDRVGTRIILSP